MVPSETKGTEVSNDNSSASWPSSAPCILSCDGLNLHTLKPTVMGRAGVMKPPWPFYMEKNACAEQIKQTADSCFGLVEMYVHCMSSVRRKSQAHTKSALQLPPE